MKTIKPTKAPTDDVLAEIRRHKEEIAKEHGFDVRKLARSLQRRQADIGHLVPPPSKETTTKAQ